jgi:hypothetical protein
MQQLPALRDESLAADSMLPTEPLVELMWTFADFVELAGWRLGGESQPTAKLIVYCHLSAVDRWVGISQGIDRCWP